MNAPPCREALCRTELVANSEAIRIASSACGQPSSHPASAARASPDLPGFGGVGSGVAARGNGIGPDAH